MREGHHERENANEIDVYRRSTPMARTTMTPSTLPERAARQMAFAAPAIADCRDCQRERGREREREEVKKREKERERKSTRGGEKEIARETKSLLDTVPLQWRARIYVLP